VSSTTQPAAGRAPQYQFEGGFPQPESAQRAHDDADLDRAVAAYRFWYPTVSMEGIFEGNRQVGALDNKAVGIASTGPRQVGFTLNSDTPYGSATVDLTGGPMVVDIPPGPFIGLADDHHQRWIMDMGIPGPDEGRGGKHLLVPPGYTGAVPPGYFAGQSSSMKVLLALRALPMHGDLEAAMSALRQVKIYPLATAAAPQPLGFIDFTDTAVDVSCLRWEDNIEFWNVLHTVIDSEPVVEEFRPMYGLLSALGIEKGKPFRPGARMTAILEQAARTGRDQMLVSAFASVRDDRMAWPDRRWEWASLVPDNADFETASGLDLEARDRWFAQAIVASPAMFRRQEGTGSLYWLGLHDADGDYLDGAQRYRLSIPQPVPAKLFWSVTVYNAQTRSQVQTDQDKAALRSLVELAAVDGDEPVDLYFGPGAPPTGSEDRWIKTVPGRGWFTYVRIYGPEQAAFDGTWRPGDITKIA
jgi:hypothetical protein